MVGLLGLLPLFLLELGSGAAAIPDDALLVDSEPDTGFGEGISGLGDVNGDGFADFAVCASRKKLPDGSEGEVRVYFGSPTGAGLEPAQVLRPPSTLRGFGFRVAGADLNQDGYGDAIVLGLQPHATNETQLTLWVYWGSPDGLRSPTNAAYQEPFIGGPTAHGNLGVIGDVNGDGFPDVAVGLPAAHQEDGEVLVFHGSPAGQWDAPQSRIRGSQPGEYLGCLGQSHGDFNGDGFDDFLVGSTHYHQWATHNGRVQLFLGSKDGLQTNVVWSATFPPFRARPDIDNNHLQFFGNFIVVDDFNHDGVSDAVITAPFAGQNDLGEGMVFAYYGIRRAPGLPSTFDWTVQANRETSSLGLMAERIGDVNGDGYPDLLVGAPDFGNHQIREGLAVVFFGSRRGFSREPDWTLESQNNHLVLGMFGAGVGDLNGDGFDDFVVSQNGSGSLLTGFFPTSVGAIRVIYGSPTGPRNSTGITLGKPALQWAAEEWRRLSRVKQTAVGVTSLTLLGLIGVVGRRIWRKRTIVLVEARERRSRAEERDRLARNLHDELSSRLSRLHLIAEMVSQDPDDPGVVRTFSQTLTREARDLRAAIEQVALTLDPASETAEGLVQALSRHAVRFFADTPVRCYQDLPLAPPTIDLPEPVRAELLPCVREAFANVLRHSGATEVWFKMRWNERSFEVSVEDNGVGFQPGSKFPGQGLKNFHTRMSRIGGRVDLDTAPGRGTRLAFTVDTANAPPTPPATAPEKQGRTVRAP